VLPWSVSRDTHTTQIKKSGAKLNYAPLKKKIVLIFIYEPAGASFSATSAVLAAEISSVSLISESLTSFSCSRLCIA
jgi:hypothetical protein